MTASDAEADRATVLADLDQSQTDFEAAVQRAPDAALRYRPAGEDYALGGLVVQPVTFSGSTEPYQTSPADAIGWVRDHYIERTQHIADLVSAWATATR